MKTLSSRLSKLEATAENEVQPIGGWLNPGMGWTIRGVVVAAEDEEPPSYYDGRPVVWGAWMDVGGQR